MRKKLAWLFVKVPKTFKLFFVNFPKKIDIYVLWIVLKIYLPNSIPLHNYQFTCVPKPDHDSQLS